VADGYKTALRYFCQDTSGKRLLAAELAVLSAGGMSTGAVYEDEATQALGGAARGRADALRAVDQAHQAGYTGLIMANLGDFHATSDQIGAIADYHANGFVPALQQNGFAYGGYLTRGIIDALHARGVVIGYIWQNAMDDLGEAGSVVDSLGHIYQRTALTRPQVSGGGYDENVLLVSGIPFHNSGVAPTPAPAPVPTPVPPPPPPPVVWVPGYPLPGTDWYGPPSNDSHNHSGYFWPGDRPGIDMIQKRLIQRGWGGIGVTDRYDGATQRTITNFQQDSNAHGWPLQVDGKTGAHTWDALWRRPVS
jgi:hypothetical protein